MSYFIDIDPISFKLLLSLVTEAFLEGVSIYLPILIGFLGKFNYFLFRDKCLLYTGLSLKFKGCVKETDPEFLLLANEGRLGVLLKPDLI
jgi:hypothetical protein